MITKMASALTPATQGKKTNLGLTSKGRAKMILSCRVVSGSEEGTDSHGQFGGGGGAGTAAVFGDPTGESEAIPLLKGGVGWVACGTRGLLDSLGEVELAVPEGMEPVRLRDPA